MQAITVSTPANVESLKLKSPYVRVQLTGEVNDAMMQAVIGKTGMLRASGQTSVVVEINSPGGSVYAGRRIAQELRLWKESGIVVITSVPSVAASMGTFLLSSGSKGHRYVGARARIMVHQASSGSAPASIENQRAWFENFDTLNADLMADLASNCGFEAEEFLGRLYRSDTFDQHLAVRGKGRVN